MTLQRDHRGVLVLEGVPRKPLYARAVAQVSAGADRILRLPVPAGQIWFINEIEVSPAANSVVTGISVDGEPLGFAASVSALAERLGGPVWAEESVEVHLSAAADDTTSYLVVRGLFVR